MSHARYRLRTTVRKHLPVRLLWPSPKGTSDCGNHAWYNADGRVENRYNCQVGVRAYSPNHSVSWIDPPPIAGTVGHLLSVVK